MSKNNSKILLIGANGQIGQKIAALMSQGDLAIKAMIRHAEQATYFDKLNIETVTADLENDFEHAFQECDQMIFTAGSGAHTGFNKTLLIDLWAAVKSIQYAEKHQFRRFIMISARGAKNPDNGPQAIKPYLIAKHAADEALIHSKLNYTILQPGRLLNEAATGLITTTRPSNPAKQIITRDDVAKAVVYCLKQPQTDYKSYELFNGEYPFEKALN